MKQNVKNYEAPQVEVVDVQVEQGFAVSAPGNSPAWKPGFDI